MTENYDQIHHIAEGDVEVLIEKGKHYGDSWKQRGGVGAFMMLARKWDRIENAVREGHTKYDILECGADDGREESLLDDIADLRRYLLLVESEIKDLRKHQVHAAKVAAATLSGKLPVKPATFDTGEPQGKGYVDQDR